METSKPSAWQTEAQTDEKGFLLCCIKYEESKLLMIRSAPCDYLTVSLQLQVCSKMKSTWSSL